MVRRFPWHARLALILSLGVLVFSVVTIVRWTGPAVALSYSWEAGEVTRDRGKLVMEMSFTPSILNQDIDMTLELTTVTRVLSVDGEGNATLEVTTEDIEVSDSSIPATPGQLTQAFAEPQTFVVAPDGRVLESSNPLIASQGLESQSFTRSPFLPDEPVAPGDTWEIDHVQELGFGEGGIDIHADNRLLRYDEVNGIETVVVKSDLDGQIDMSFHPSDLSAEALPQGLPADAADFPSRQPMRYTGELTADMESWIDPLTGEVLRGEGELSMSISINFGAGVPSFGTEVNMEIETERLD